MWKEKRNLICMDSPFYKHHSMDRDEYPALQGEIIKVSKALNKAFGTFRKHLWPVDKLKALLSHAKPVKFQEVVFGVNKKNSGIMDMTSTGNPATNNPYSWAICVQFPRILRKQTEVHSVCQRLRKNQGPEIELIISQLGFHLLHASEDGRDTREMSELSSLKQNEND